MEQPNSPLLAVDLGKTSCRVAVLEGANGPESRTEVDGPGVVGLAGPNGANQVRDVIVRTLAGTDVEPKDIGIVAVGMPGYHAGTDRLEALAEGLASAFPAAQIVLASDVTTTHLGAMSGDPGAVVAAGTGSVALAIDAQGRSAVTNGWGYLLGDDGSGYTVGRSGVRAALEVAEGQGSAELARRAEDHFGIPVDQIPSLVQSAANPARLIAGFASQVADAAHGGDPLAAQIWTDAAHELADIVLRARDLVDPGLPVALAGGLGDVGDLLRDPFDRAIETLSPGTTVVSSGGRSLDGAVALGLMAAESDGFGPWTEHVTVRAPRASAPVVDALGQLPTEQMRTDLADLDQRATQDIVTTLWEAEAAVPEVLLPTAPILAAAVDATVERLRAGGRIFYLGAGTPGRLGYVDASELPPTYGVDPSLVQALLAGGDDAFGRATEASEDNAESAVQALESHGANEGDVVVGITAFRAAPPMCSPVLAGRRSTAR